MKKYLKAVWLFSDERGFTEFDDVVHNVAGGMICYGLYFMIRFLHEKVS